MSADEVAGVQEWVDGRWEGFVARDEQGSGRGGEEPRGR